MDVSSAAVGLPVSDLAAAVTWYRQVLELAEPDLQPADGVVEFKVGSLCLQTGAARRRYAARRPARRLMTYGCANIYRPVNRRKASGNRGT
jgi:catechol 2,3-dioxygenase-like lactoylglutathione lyase family enzyme